MLERVISKKAGWTRVAFGDVVRKVNDKVDPWESGLERYVAGDHMVTDDLRIRRWGTIGDDYLGPAFHMRFKPGHVLYGSRRTYLRKVALADFEGITANTTFVLESKDSSILMPELLPFIMQTEAFHANSIARSKGSVNPYVNFPDVACFEFSLPPIQEQARLVEVMSAHWNALEGIRSAEASLARLQSSFIEDFIEKKHPDAPTIRVSQLLREGPRNGKSPQAAEQENGFKTVSISSVANGVFNPDGCIKFVDISASEAAPFLVAEGDAYAIRGNGNRNLMGKVGLVTQAYPDLIYPDLLIRLRFDETKILKEFAAAQWNHPSVHIQLASRAKSSNGIWKVNGQDIRAHTLKVPTLDAQKSAVSILSEFQGQAIGLQKRFRQLRAIQTFLYDQAFAMDVK
ncbi:restriction endonuclease subunit S [Thioclava sp.]|uniref:restriction endonuclease subunit S n=1 Tax=Thioclava sp. TaxID=1933450 RepID=UPI003AA9769C